MKIVAIIFGIVILVVGYFGLRHTIYTSFVKNRFEGLSQAKVLDECSQTMQIVFPKSTIVLYANKELWQDEVITLKVEMNKTDLNIFLKKSPFGDKLTNGISPEVHSHPDRWTSENSKVFLSGRVSLQNPKADYGEHIEVIIDLDHKEKTLIYLRYFTSYLKGERREGVETF